MLQIMRHQTKERKKKCSVLHCLERKTTFHRFPSDPKLCVKWARLCGNEKVIGKTVHLLSQSHCVCTNHFREEEKYKATRGLRFKGNHSVPSLLLPAPIDVVGIASKIGLPSAVCLNYDIPPQVHIARKSDIQVAEIQATVPLPLSPDNLTESYSGVSPLRPHSAQSLVECSDFMDVAEWESQEGSPALSERIINDEDSDDELKEGEFLSEESLQSHSSISQDNECTTQQSIIMDTNLHRNPGHRMCSYYACVITSTNSPGASFHRIPTNRDRARQWIQHINQPSFHLLSKEQLVQKSVCNMHFPADAFDHSNLFKRKLRQNAVPFMCQKPAKQLEIEKYNEDNGIDPFATEATDSVPYTLDYKSIDPNDNHQHPFFSALRDTTYLSPKESRLDVIPAVDDSDDDVSCSRNKFKPKFSFKNSSKPTPMSRNKFKPKFSFKNSSKPTTKLRTQILRPALQNKYDNEINSVTFHQQKDIHHENTSLCRICAEKHDDLIEIFSNESLQRDLCEKINTLLPIQVTVGDILPVQVCHSCVENLETAYQLRATCTKADMRLRILFEQDMQAGVELNEAMDNSVCIEDASDQEMDRGSPLEELHAEMKDDCRLLTQLHPQVPTISTPQLFCHACNLEIPIAPVFINHMKHTHRKLIKQCQHCFTFFSTSRALSDHVFELHEDRADDKIIATKLRRKQQRQAKQIKKPRFCKACNLHFSNDQRKEYLKHLAEHRAEVRAQQLVKSEIVCDYCDMRFLTDRSKKFHMSQTHGQYKPFTCNLCAKTFHLRQSLVSHMGIHNQVQGFLCEICAKPFHSKHSLTSHVRSSHDKKLCSICGKECSAVSYRKHMDCKHLNERKLRCDDCGHSFYTAQELSTHTNHHNTHPFRCYICGDIYRFESSLYSHMESHKHVANKNFTCPVPICRSQFESTQDIIQHCGTHDKQDLPKLKTSSDISIKVMTLLCTYCNSSFRKVLHYTHHLKRQHSLTTSILLTCNICKTDWPDEQSLTDHLETHPEAFDFSCRHCLQTFVSDTQRSDHEKLAHGRARQCNICFKILKSHNQLTLHSKQHSAKVKTVSCPLCDKMFYDRKGLTKHKRTHQEKHLTCDICSKKFRWQHDLRKHYYLIHTNEKMYKCEECEFSSNTLKDVEKHKYLKHDEDLSLESDTDSD